MKQMIKKSFFLAVLVFAVNQLFAQTAEIPFHKESVNFSFGVHNGMSIEELDASGAKLPEIQPSPARTIAFPASSYIVLQETFNTLENAPWMQLVFGDVYLGENSYLVITSEFDQDQQFFNNQSIEEWMYHSAYFKGGLITMQLYIAPGDQGITTEVKDIVAGEFVGGGSIILSQCGPTDDRVASTYPYIDGRLMPFGCTGWIAATGFYLTAGHCQVLINGSTIMEFNVPLSLANGTTQPAAVNDQYPVVAGSIGQNAGVGDDWGIYNCGANSNTGLTPVEAQRAYYHLSKDLAPPSIFIRGFGVDVGTANQTLQFHTGPSLGETTTSANDIFWQYQTDTEGGNSGSSVLANGVGGVDFHSIGIHTHGGCTTNNPPTGGNAGTSFEADDTETNMNSFWQSEIEYVDVDHHLSSNVGSSVYPHQSLQTALSQANAGHGPGVGALELILVAGSNNGSGGVYQQAISYSGATNGVVIRRSVGGVKIGPAAVASFSVIPGNSNTGEKQ
jgi:V8-like Glu-specific endopeptidase